MGMVCGGGGMWGGVRGRVEWLLTTDPLTPSLLTNSRHAFRASAPPSMHCLKAHASRCLHPGSAAHPAANPSRPCPAPACRGCAAWTPGAWPC